MPVYFATARSPAASPVARVLAKRTAATAANDQAAADPAGDAVLREALLHFASTGLAAAASAHAEAERAFAAGDAPSGRRWQEVCGVFDRRLAATVCHGEPLL